MEIKWVGSDICIKMMVEKYMKESPWVGNWLWCSLYCLAEPHDLFLSRKKLHSLLTGSEIIGIHQTVNKDLKLCWAQCGKHFHF